MARERTSGRWWGRVALGVIALIAGLAFLLVPGITLVVFLWIFGAFMILTGLVLISYAWSRPKGTTHRSLNFVEGGINVVIGVIALLAPGLTSLLVIYLVAAFAIISGILQIAEGILTPTGRTTWGTSSRWMLVIAGAWALLIGVLLALFPAGGALALMWLIGILLIVLGVFNILSGIRGRPVTDTTGMPVR